MIVLNCLLQIFIKIWFKSFKFWWESREKWNIIILDFIFINVQSILKRLENIDLENAEKIIFLPEIKYEVENSFPKD